MKRTSLSPLLQHLISALTILSLWSPASLAASVIRLENPQPGSFQSGIGVISGWVCEADRVEIRFFNDQNTEISSWMANYGTSRDDTLEACGDTNNGFSLLFNWNLLNPGVYTVAALTDDPLIDAFSTIKVSTLSLGEFPTGLRGEFSLPDFPSVDAETTVRWEESLQNFVVTTGSGGGNGSAGVAPRVLENPQPGSFQSGVGAISGWVCEADRIEIEFHNGVTGQVSTLEAGYGTSRSDTLRVCGDINNSFGLLFNWNLLGDGLHTVRALADGVEFARSTFTVSTLGLGEFATGLSEEEFLLPDFPTTGAETIIRWEESLQNFVIIHARESDDRHVATGPSVVAQFEDSVVVMKIPGSLTTDAIDFDELTRVFFAHYEDVFDYLIFLSNLPDISFNKVHDYYGAHQHVKNSVEGIGLGLFTRNKAVGSAGKLGSVIHFSYSNALLFGPALHEMMHRWANHIIPTSVGSHWGFSSANGQLGGFDLADLVRLGNGRYSAGHFGIVANGGNSVPYSPIELYLAGLIPPEEVPDLWIAKDGRWLDEHDDAGNRIFTASEIETWSIERIVREYGARVPNFHHSQKHFRAATVLLVDESFPETREQLQELSAAVRQFAHAGNDSNHRLFNFWEATGGRATLALDGLDQYRRN